MGCLFSRFGFFQNSRQHLEEEKPEPKQYSWDLKRDTLNVKDYILDGVKGETVGRLPGTVNGQQFVIQNCQDCNIYIFDHTATVTVDDCVNCNVFLGPIKTSVFIRDCKNCKFVVACQQFRTRDCSQIDIFLCCGTQPIIESSSGMRFGCFQYFYPQLAGQFEMASLSVYNNSWSTIHDFTQDPTETHFSLLPQDAKCDAYVPIPTSEPFDNMQISLEMEKSIIPLTLGERRKPSDESCLLVFFSDGSSHDRSHNYIELMRANHPEIVLVQTKEVKMQPEDALRVFGTESYTLPVQQGPVIGLEFNGPDSIAKCQEVVVNLTKGTTGMVFVSQLKSSASKQLESFYNFTDMAMSM